MIFGPAQLVVVQEVWHDRVWAARPMRVVRDDGDAVALWFPKGTMWKAPTSPPTRPRAASRGERLASALALGDWVFVDAAWNVSTLVLMQAGEAHAVWVSWLDDGSQWGWYINLQAPYRRTPKGFQTMDHVLDVVVELDRTWRWKDDDELRTFVEMGVFEPGFAEELRAEGLRVVRRAELAEPPFDGAWPRWRPDPSWELPELAAGWDDACP